MTANFNFFGSKSSGLQKELNEDFFGGYIHNDVLYLVIADGMGGKEGLDLASAVAMNEFRRHIEKQQEVSTPAQLKVVIREGIFWANRILLAYRRANEEVYGNFATTFTVCALNGNKEIVIGHVGNSRLYLLRDESFAQMTTDHTEAQNLLVQKKITKEEVRTHPERATLTKALGVWENLEPDIFSGKVKAEDILFLCTDGVYGLLTDEEMQAVIWEAGESQKASEWLIEGATKRGGVDNIAAMLSYIAL